MHLLIVLNHIGFTTDTIVQVNHLLHWMRTPLFRFESHANHVPCILRWPSQQSPHRWLIVLHRLVTLRSMDYSCKANHSYYRRLFPLMRYMVICPSQTRTIQCWTWSGFRIAIQPDSAIQNWIRIELDFEKTLPDQMWTSKVRWSLQSNAYSEFFQMQTGLDQMFGENYRISTGLNFTMKILDWIRIAKNTGSFNTTTRQ